MNPDSVDVNQPIVSTVRLCRAPQTFTAHFVHPTANALQHLFVLLLAN